MRTRSNALEHPIASPAVALDHFRSRLSFETDCADLYGDLVAEIRGFTVIDTRTGDHYAEGHVPGAINIPHRRLSASTLDDHSVPTTDVLITYCAGPHCNASTRGAIRLSELGRAVKEMPGGVLGWTIEGFPLVTGTAPGSLRAATRT